MSKILTQLECSFQIMCILGIIVVHYKSLFVNSHEIQKHSKILSKEDLSTYLTLVKNTRGKPRYDFSLY